MILNSVGGIMPRKCSVGGCTSNYVRKGVPTEKVTVYGFPSDEVERQRWISAMPNILPKVTPTMGVCRLHFPRDVKMKRIKGHNIPVDPPSIFAGIPPSFCVQTPNHHRDLERRCVTSEKRNAMKMSYSGSKIMIL